MKIKYKFLILMFIVLLFFLNDYFSYKRRIGNTNFYLVETMAVSDRGKPLAGLFYKPDGDWGYCGENIPGFPETIYWNDRYIISKNSRCGNQKIDWYLVIDLDSIDPNCYGLMKNNIHIFEDEKSYYDYLMRIRISEASMNKTDNHILW